MPGDGAAVESKPMCDCGISVSSPAHNSIELAALAVGLAHTD